MHTPRITLAAFWLWVASLVSMQATASPMRTYQIELPQHTLRFSLPEEIAEKIRPGKIEQHFDAQDPSFIKNGFREIAGNLYDVNGPFWIGAYGSLRFHVIVQKKSPSFLEDITTLDGLERYVRQWTKAIEVYPHEYIFSRTMLNGVAAVRREADTFNDPSKREPEALEIFSLPLNSEMFLDVGLSVQAWQGGRGKESKWRPKVEALRDAIRATVVLAPKP